MATPKSPAADHIDFTGEEKAVETSVPLVDAAEEKALLRKIDLHLLPILWILYLCAFIDRCDSPATMPFVALKIAVSTLVMQGFRDLKQISTWLAPTTT